MNAINVNNIYCIYVMLFLFQKDLHEAALLHGNRWVGAFQTIGFQK
jgi:hypothetical protein